MELGRAYIGIHADGAAFPAEAEAGVDGALAAIQATADEAFAAVQLRSDEAFTAVAARAEEAFKTAGAEIDAAFGVTADGITVEADRMAARIAELAAQIETDMGATSTRLGKDWNAFASMFAEDAARVQAEAEVTAAAVEGIGAGAQTAGAQVTAAAGAAAEALARLDGAEVTSAEEMATIGTAAEAASAKTVAAMDEAAAATGRVGAAAKTSSVDGLLGGLGSQVKGIAPLAAGFGLVEAIKGAGDLQSNLTKLATTAGELPANLDADRAAILAMSNEYGVSANKIAQAMYTVDGANFHGADSVQVMKAAVQGAVQEHADLRKVVDAVTTTLHDYNLGADQAANVTSKLVAGTSTGKISFEALTGALHSVEPAAAVAHLSIGETVADLAAMTAAGMTAQQASDNLNGTLRNFERPSLVMQKNLADIGLDAQDLRDHLGDRGLAGTLQLISNHITSKMGPDGLVARNIINQNKAALSDLNTMAQQIPGSLGDMAKGLLTGQTSYEKFYKAAKGDGSPIGAMAQQFAAAYKANDGFSQTLKSGQPILTSYLGALAGAVGTQDAVTVALQLTADHQDAVNAAIAKSNGAVADAKGNVAGWSEVQGNFNLQLGRAEQSVVNFGIGVGQKLLPTLTSFAGWIADRALPGLKDFGHALEQGWNSNAFQTLLGMVDTAGSAALAVLKGLGNVLGPLAHLFGELPGPVQLVVGALIALKAASVFGVFDKMAASNSRVISGLGKSVTAVGSFRASYKTAMDQAAADSERFAAAVREASLQGEEALQALFASVQEVGAAEGELVTRTRAIGTAFAETMPRTAAAVDAATGAMTSAWGRVTAAAAEAKLAQQEAAMAQYGVGAGGISKATGDLAALRAASGQVAKEIGGGLKSAVGGAVNMLGGPFGLAVIGAGIELGLYQSAMQKVDEVQKSWTEDLKKGGDAARTAQQQMKLAAGGLDGFGKAMGGTAGGMAQFLSGVPVIGKAIDSMLPDPKKAQDTYNQWVDGLKGVQRAQFEVNQAEQDYNDKAGDYGANSAAAQAAAGVLRDKQEALAKATNDAAEAAKSQAQQQQDAANAILATLDAQRAATEAQLQLADQIDNYNKGVADGTLKGNALKESQLALVDSAERTAQAAADAAAKMDLQKGITDTAADSQKALTQSLQDTADKLTGPAKQAVLDMIVQIEGWRAQAQDAANKMTNLGLTVEDIPSTKFVHIDAPTQAQEDQLTKLGYHVEHLPDGSVIVSANTNPAMDDIKAMQLWTRLQTFTIPVHTQLVGGGGQAIKEAAGGVVHAFAAGGFEPMDSSLAQFVPPQTWRVVGDRMTNDEAFIPIDGSNRSRALWAETGHRLGMAGGGQQTHFHYSPQYALPQTASAEQVGAIVGAHLERDVNLALAGTGVFQ